MYSNLIAKLKILKQKILNQDAWFKEKQDASDFGFFFFFFLILTQTRTSGVSDKLAGTFETLIQTCDLLKYLLSMTSEFFEL